MLSFIVYVLIPLFTKAHSSVPLNKIGSGREKAVCVFIVKVALDCECCTPRSK